MIVIDVESSGVDSRVHSLLSIGAVDFSNPSNRFYAECRIFDGARVEDEALTVNGFTRKQAIDPEKMTDKELLEKFISWSNEIPEKTLAGHNTSFDEGFLKMAAERYHINWPFAKRTLDLHSICYAHMIMKGVTPPTKDGHSALNSEKVSDYVGIPIEPKPHNGLNGALWEAEAFSRLMLGKSLMPEFLSYSIPWN